MPSRRRRLHPHDAAKRRRRPRKAHARRLRPCRSTWPCGRLDLPIRRTRPAPPGCCRASIDRGTTGAAHRPTTIAEELDARGITLTITVSRHLLSFVCTCLAEDFEPVLALLADIMMSPSLPDEELETRKAEVVTAIRQDADNPAVRASEALMALLYPDGHPYGRRTKGTHRRRRVDRARRLVATVHGDRFGPDQVTRRDCRRRRDAIASWTSPPRVFGDWRKPSARRARGAARHARRASAAASSFR